MDDVLFDDYDKTGRIIAQEPSGLLNLHSRDNTALLHKESIDNYIYDALTNESYHQNLFLYQPLLYPI